jgi:hypothetical protein
MRTKNVSHGALLLHKLLGTRKVVPQILEKGEEMRADPELLER